jgi:opacity protein-like surface antigen
MVTIFMVHNLISFTNVSTYRVSAEIDYFLDTETTDGNNYECMNVGGEYVFYDFLYLRAGMKSLFQKESEEGLTFGIGVKQFLIGNLQFTFDYAYLDFGRLKYVQKVDLGIFF